MSVKKDNKRITITLDSLHLAMLDELCKFWKVSKTKLINWIIDYTWHADLFYGDMPKEKDK